MNFRTTVTLILLLVLGVARAQQHDAEILRTLLSHYYKTEKAVVKGRTQFLFLYCGKVNNNEEILETVKSMDLPQTTFSKIKKQVLSSPANADWGDELNAIFDGDRSRLETKINSCFTLEEYQDEYKKRNVNNQRLMVVSKPILYDANHAIVKVVFYRTVEHNNGSVVHLERVGAQWVIREFLNPWST